MIARTWRGATRAEDADAYLDYLHQTGFAGDDIERAVFFPEDDRLLLERDDRVEYFDVVYREGAGREDPGSEPLSAQLP